MAELNVEARRREDGDGRSITMPVVKAPAPEDALPSHVVSHASGGRDQWSPPLAQVPEDREAAAWDCLREVLDPELPISLVDLGLIYGLELEDEAVRVDLTFTATACPCMEFIKEDISDRLMQESWISRVDIQVVWDPPWTRERISEKGREELRRLGVGV